MAAPMEVIISTDGAGQLWNACVWDMNTGTSLAVYKGGGDSTGHSLSMISGQYLISAASSKPLVHLWTLQTRDERLLRMVLPGRVTALDVTPDGNYCIVAISERIHIWQLCTGNLLGVVTRHYQNVSCLKVVDDGNTFVSGGEDNLVIVWSLASIFSEQMNQTSKVDPEHVWTSHALPITDLHVGRGGARSRIVSSSLDQTCKLWDLSSGQLLCTFIFDVSIMSVTMDTTEFRLFAGGSNGTIYTVNLYAEPVQSERHFPTWDSRGTAKFSGHSKQVTCLRVSLDGTKLVSGSHDCTARVWDVTSGQCVKTLSHKGPVTNVLVELTPPSLIDPELKPNLPIKQFKRNLESGLAGPAGDSERVLNIQIKSHKEKSESYQAEDANAELRKEISKLKSINQKMYTFAVNEILHKTDKVS
ncbi:hypothetical protein ScPMuIL_005828 [Solemya velum]